MTEEVNQIYKRKEIDMKLSLVIKKQPSVKKTVISIDEDTSFDIYFDIYDDKYLYIKMEENTIDAPFFYNRSYELSELCKINRIFKTCENLDEVKYNIEMLFQKNKIRIRYDKNNKEIIIMEMDVVLFAIPMKVEFKLYKEMIPQEEKDPQLISLYNQNKEKIKTFKKIYALIRNNLEDEKNKKICDMIKSLNIHGIGD